MPGTPPSRFPFPAHRRVRLGNGVRVILVPNRRVPAFTASLLVTGGGASDTDGKAGRAVMTAALINQGSRHRDSAALAGAVDDRGASYSAAAGWDLATTSLTGLAEDAPILIDLLAEITLEPTFPLTEFTAMQGRRLHRLTRALDHAGQIADWTFAVHLGAGGPYARPLGGTWASVAGLSVEDVRSWHRASFVPECAWLALAGDLDAEEVLTRAEAAFGAWEAGPRAPYPEAPPAAPGKSRILVVDRPDLSQAQIRWGHPGVARSDPDHDAADLVNDPLGGGGFSSRLMARIRSAMGLTYGVSSSFDARRLPGPFVISTFTPSVSVPEVVREIDRLVAEYAAEGPTAEELQAAKDRLIGGYPLQLETPTQVASHLLEADFYGLPEDEAETYPARLAAVDGPAAARLARRLLRPAQRLVVVVGDTAAFMGGLERLGPVERFDARAAFGPSHAPGT